MEAIAFCQRDKKYRSQTARRLACFASTVNKLVVCFASSSERQKAAILQSHLAARGGRIFSAYFSVNCLLHISIKYTENVTNLYAHAQTVDTRCSSPIFQAPGYEASALLHKWPWKRLLSPCRDSISGIVGCFQSRGAFSGRRALTIEHLLMSGCGQVQRTCVCIG